MAEKKPREKGDPPLDQKKEQRPEPRCQVEEDLSPGLVVEEEPAGQGQRPQGKTTELWCEAKEIEGRHERNLSEIKSRQCHGNEPRKPSASAQEKPKGENHYVQKESEPLREKETKPLPQIVRSQNPLNKRLEGERLSQEQPKSWEARETKAKDDRSAQATQQTLPPGHFQAQLQAPHAPAPKGPAAQSARPAAGPSLGERREADTGSGDSEDGDVVFVSCQPGSPSLSDLTLGSQKKENLLLPGQTVQRKTPPVSGVSEKAEPLGPAAQRTHLLTQLKQKKVTAG